MGAAVATEQAAEVTSEVEDDGWLDWLAVALGGGGLAAGLVAIGRTTRKPKGT